jgi:AcrR family transcriptional regulator
MTRPFGYLPGGSPISRIWHALSGTTFRYRNGTVFRLLDKEPKPVADSEKEAPRTRADARRNKETLLEAAAKSFVAAGVDVPVRDVAARAGVGVATIYRHFPTRSDLIIAVYRHQVEACAEAGPELLATSTSPYAALREWIGLFVDFLVTKHGLAKALQSDDAAFQALHSYFVDRLVPVCAQLLERASESGEVPPGVDAYGLLRGVGNLCIGAENDQRYEPRRLVDLLISGLRVE